MKPNNQHIFLGNGVCSALVATVALSFMLLGGSAFAATISLPTLVADSRAGDGDEVSVTVHLDDGQGVFGYLFDISFSTSILEYVDAQQAGLSMPWNLFEKNDGDTNTTGRLIVASSGTPALSGSGGLVEIRFRVKPGLSNGAFSSLHFSQAELNDGLVPASTADGKITVGSTAYLGVPQELFAEPGQTVEVPIVLKNVNNVTGIFLEIAYDPNVLTPDLESSQLALTQGSKLQSNWQLFGNDNIPNRVLIAGSGSQTSIGNGTEITSLTFMVNGGAPLNGVAPVIVESVEINDGAKGAIPTTGLVRMKNERNTVWVDFGASGNEDGSSGAPVNDMYKAQSVAKKLNSGDPTTDVIVRIRGNVPTTHTDGIFIIDTRGRYTAENGTVRIGGNPSAKSTAFKTFVKEFLSN